MKKRTRKKPSRRKKTAGQKATKPILVRYKKLNQTGPLEDPNDKGVYIRRY